MGYELTARIEELTIDVPEAEREVATEVPELTEAELDKVVGGLDYSWSETATTLFEP